MKFSLTWALYTVLLSQIITPVLFFIIHLFYICLSDTLFLAIGIAGFIVSFVVAKTFALKNSPKKLMMTVLIVILFIFITLIWLASLNDVRSVSPYGSAKQSFNNTRVQAELIYERENYSYESVCEDENVKALVDNAELHANLVKQKTCLGVIPKMFLPESETNKTSYSVCTATKNEYEIQLYIPAHDLFWCIDSSNKPKFPNPDDDLTEGDLCAPLN